MKTSTEIKGDIMEVNTDVLVEAYIAIRDEKDALYRDYQENLKRLETELKVVGDALMEICNSTNADSIRTKAGTVVKSIKSNFWTNDWESFYNFMQEHNAFNLLEKRIHQGNIKLFLEENPDLLPMGLNIDKSYAVRVVRRK
jgi:hypothetical protein